MLETPWPWEHPDRLWDHTARVQGAGVGGRIFRGFVVVSTEGYQGATRAVKRVIYYQGCEALVISKRVTHQIWSIRTMFARTTWTMDTVTKLDVT